MKKKKNWVELVKKSQRSYTSCPLAKSHQKSLKTFCLFVFRDRERGETLNIKNWDSNHNNSFIYLVSHEKSDTTFLNGNNQLTLSCSCLLQRQPMFLCPTHFPHLQIISLMHWFRRLLWRQIRSEVLKYYVYKKHLYVQNLSM